MKLGWEGNEGRTRVGKSASFGEHERTTSGGERDVEHDEEAVEPKEMADQERRRGGCARDVAERSRDGKHNRRRTHERRREERDETQKNDA